MRIGCDLTALVKPRAGVRIYVEQIYAHLRGHELIGYHPNRGREITRHIPALWMQCEGMRLALADRLDVFWSGLYTVPRALPGRVPVVVTVHDVIWKVMPETMRFRTRLGVELRARHAIESADCVVAVSEASAADVRKYYSARRVEVVHSGVNPVYGPGDSAEGRRVAERYGLRGRYAIFVGTIEPRKNLPRVLRCFPSGDVELAIVGAKGWKSTTPNARVLGYVPDEDLRWLYVAAEFLVFPTLYEGFGLPIVEAMACGCPVLTSNVSSMPEVAGDAALMVDPEDDRAVTEGLRRMIEDGGLRARLREAGLRRVGQFSWRKAAEKYVSLFEELRYNPALRI